MVALELAALLYALLGYAILLYMGYRTFVHLCVRWGLVWHEALNPYALRAAALATIPLVGVSVMIAFGLLEPKGNLAQAGFVTALLAFIVLVVYQAWTFAQSAPEDDDAGDTR
ncbi:MAG: hypothetical protein HRF45_07595 [Fimbriimonadia bacterium]|jgi:hypothetical protein